MKSLPPTLQVLLFLTYPTICTSVERGPSAQPYIFQADHLRAISSGAEFHIEGGIRLEAPFLSIHGDSATLDPEQRLLQVRNPDLVFGSFPLRLHAQFLRASLHDNAFFLVFPTIKVRSLTLKLTGTIGECRQNSCIVFDARLFPCSNPSPVHIASRKLILYPNHTVDLLDNHLVLDQIHFPFPFLRIQPKDKIGLTPPTIGFSKNAGVILGTGGVLPVGNSAFRGRFAIRSRQGFETVSETHTDIANLSLKHLQLRTRPHFWLQGSVYPGAASSFHADLNWVSNDRYIIDELSLYALERAITHTTSRFHISVPLNSMLLESYFNYIQLFPQIQDAPPVRTYPAAGLHLDLPSLSIFDGWFSGLDTTLQYQDFYIINSIHNSKNIDPSALFFTLHPSLTGAGRIGIFSAKTIVESFNILSISRFSTSLYRQNNISWRIKLSTTIFRDYKKYRHTITPSMTYRFLPFESTHLPDHFQRFYTQSPVNTVRIGLSTALLHVSTGTRVRMDINDSFFNDKFSSPIHPQYLQTQFSISTASSGTLSIDAALDHHTNRFSFWGISLAHARDSGRFFFSTRYLSTLDGPHLQYSFDRTAFRTLWDTPIFPPTRERIEQILSYNFTLNKNFSVFTGARINLLPSLSYNTIWYGLQYHSSCKCLQIRCTFSHPPGVIVPSFNFHLEFAPF